MIEILGKCSCCGGDVIHHIIQWSVKSMSPYCERCGAVPKAQAARVIETEPVKFTFQYRVHGDV